MTKISQYIYHDHGRQYAVDGWARFTGRPKGTSSPEDKPHGWYLNDYLQRNGQEQGILVNCIDQSYALNSLARLVGIEMFVFQFEGVLPLLNTIRLVGLDLEFKESFIMHRVCVYEKIGTDTAVCDPTEGELSAQKIKTVIGHLPFWDYISRTLQSKKEGMSVDPAKMIITGLLPLK